VLFEFVGEVIGASARRGCFFVEAQRGIRDRRHACLDAAPPDVVRNKVTGLGLAQHQAFGSKAPGWRATLGSTNSRAIRVRSRSRLVTSAGLRAGRRLAVQHRPLGEEARRSLERVAAHAASALARIDLARMVERQRAALAVLLDTHEVPRDDAGIARWLSMRFGE